MRTSGNAKSGFTAREVNGDGLGRGLRAWPIASAIAAVLMWTSLGLAAAMPQQTGSGGASPSSARPDENVLVSVPATAPWTDTGLVVRPGDRLDIRAWGRVTYGRGEDVKGLTPAGSGRGGGCRFALVDAAVPADALVANIAPGVSFDGRGFTVGASRSVTVPVAGSTASEGRLFVGINHQGVMCDRSGYDSWEFRNNGAGAFTVEIAVRRKK